MSKTKHLVLHNVRCIYPKLFRPDEYMGKSNYTCGFLLEAGSEQLEALKNAITEAVVNEFGEAKAAGLLRKFSGSRTTWPLRVRDEADGGGFMIQPKRSAEKGRPTLLDRRKNPIETEGQIYGGCWVNASIDVYAYTNNGGGVTTYLRGIQLVREDAPLAGAAASCEADFEDLGDDGSKPGAEASGGDMW